MSSMSWTALSGGAFPPAAHTVTAQAAASNPTKGSNGSDDSVKFSSSDFMTLLVAEMKNQDPTSPTDPTQYVSQLVSVNSLQQLIEINEGVNGTDSAQTNNNAKSAV